MVFKTDHGELEGSCSVVPIAGSGGGAGLGGGGDEGGWAVFAVGGVYRGVEPLAGLREGLREGQGGGARLGCPQGLF